MARGKHAAAAATRRLREAEERIAELENDLRRSKQTLRDQQLDYEDKLRRQGVEVSRQVAERVRDAIGDGVDRAAEGLSAAVWRAQRTAMTEHLGWLFFRGLITWDRMAGDREVLKFIAVHGEPRAWWRICDMYGWRYNHDDRRRAARGAPFKVLLATIEDIVRAEESDDRSLREAREALDAVVDRAREVFTEVTLGEVLTDDEWPTRREPTEDELELFREIVRSVPEVLAVARRA